MSKQVLQLKYHPAKKEIKFTLVNSGKKTPITGTSRSVLAKYINERGHFVLQDHGNQFFNDILEVFDGQRNVSLEVTTTKGDFEDFEQMIEFFNKTSDVKITATQLAELPDMNTAYEAIKKHGLDSIEILNVHRNQFYDVPTDNEHVKACIDNFAREINEVTKGIKEKINTLDQNTVNVCFSGPYSSGKSLLIDSLIGFDILPTDIRPETAAMFTIRSPKAGDNVKVIFHITDVEESYCEVVWNENEGAFIFAAGPVESQTRKTIQEVMNASVGKMRHEQLKDILKSLNESRFVERLIDVYFPISIDNDKAQFTIYDTPGTDSGISAHKSILIDALSEQTHSILVFVTYPQGLSGGGNRALLEYLSDIDHKEDKSTIDLGRSLFVINHADDLFNDEDFEKLRLGKISNKMDVEDKKKTQEDGTITIKLSDKKLFFTSAKYAYPAIAVKNGVATKTDKKLLKAGSGMLLDDEFGRYYRHDSCATSEFATNLLVQRSIEAFERAEENGDLAAQMWVASGMYALHAEIMAYGEKYASAVKAFSIIDGVDKALARLHKNATAIERQNSDDITAVEAEIKAIKDTITGGIENAKVGRELKSNSAIPDGVVEELRLNADAISTYVQSPVDRKVDDILLGAWQKAGRWVAEKFDVEFNPEETKWDESKEDKIEDVVQEVLDDYIEYFKNKRKLLLEKLRDSFIADVRKAVMESGEISEDAKEYIIAIETPEIEEFTKKSEFGDLYRKKKKTKKVLWMDKEYLDRKAFLRDINTKLAVITGELADEYKTNYRESLNSMLKKVESEFTVNMEQYSLSLRAKLEDKDAMEKLKDKILAAVAELRRCQKTLDSGIWEVKE